MKSRIESLEDIIKLLSTQIVERDDLLKRVYERIDSEVLRKEVDNIIPKWYDNIPEQGVLCWCFEDDKTCKRVVARIDSYTPRATEPRTDSFIANWGFLNIESWVWYETAQPLTNEEIEEFKR